MNKNSDNNNKKRYGIIMALARATKKQEPQNNRIDNDTKNTCLRVYLPSVLTCLRARMLNVLAFLNAWCACVLAFLVCSHAWRPCLF